MTGQSPEAVVRQWWEAVHLGDYAFAAALLAPGTVVDWPLTGERMQSALDWQQINERYPAPAPWRAEVIDLIVDGDNVVSFVQVFNESINDLAISRFTVREGSIVKLVEFWPEPYAAPSWRTPWVTPIPAHENPMKRLSEDTVQHAN